MSIIPMPNPAAPMTPANALLHLCERLPDRFRLADPQVGHQYGPGTVRTPFVFNDLEIDMGPGWTLGGVYLVDGTADIHEAENAPMALQAVLSYCFDERVPLRFELRPEDPWNRICTVVVGSGVPHGRGASASAPVAALLALAAYLVQAPRPAADMNDVIRALGGEGL